LRITVAGDLFRSVGRRSDEPEMRRSAAVEHHAKTEDVKDRPRHDHSGHTDGQDFQDLAKHAGAIMPYSGVGVLRSSVPHRRT
jgi:hypothetical protein